MWCFGESIAIFPLLCNDNQRVKPVFIGPVFSGDKVASKNGMQQTSNKLFLQQWSPTVCSQWCRLVDSEV